MSPARTRALCAALLALAVVLLYWPVRGHDWIRYDDDVYVLDNALVRTGFTGAGVRAAFTSELAANYHPLTWLSHMLDVELFGLTPRGPHLVNVGLHALAAVLALYCLAGLGLAPLLAALGASLFALHPLRVESVAWIAERKDVLCAVFTLLALLLHLAHARTASPGRRVASLLAFLLALLAKPMAVSLPLVLLLVERHRLGRVERATWRALAPYFALAALFSALTLWAQAHGGSTSDAGELAFDLRVLNALASVAVYLRQSVWPTGLAVFYPHAAEAAEGARAALLGPATLGVLVLAGWPLAARVLGGARGRTFALGGALALVMLLPVLGLVQVGTQAHADRYTYLPSFGLVLALVGGLPALAQRGLALALVPLCVLSTRQLAHWRDTATLFTHALAVDAENHVAHMKLGELARDGGNLVLARASFARAVQAAPRYVLGWNELGLAARGLGDPAAARAALERAYALDPADATTAMNLGVVLLEAGELARADTLFLAAEHGLADDPDLASNRGLLALAGGDREAAEAFFRGALALDPRHVEAWSHLGELSLAEGKPERALECFTRALELTPDDAVSHFNVGVAAQAAGDLARARGAYERALALDPELAPARARLAGLPR